MKKYMTPREILESASPNARKTVNEILEIEQEYQNYKNLQSVTGVEKEIAKRIKQLIERGVK
ncbi:tryptophan synthase alpha subunit [Natronocella acetinitrilica]|uniref:Tryptophan synthase alpha subunit n=1 Tax=Natronocella acetinitrilica TaxID=414046 RepID=A0AAE3KCA0_9GAMM|nr:tryptophan synthase alpha subunit [Natronocella acetinitrilica]